MSADLHESDHHAGGRPPADPAPAPNPAAAEISRLADLHHLAPAEVARLRSVLTDYDPADHAAELAEEVRNILAARELAALPPLTLDVVDRVRRAVEAGRTPFVPQDMD